MSDATLTISADGKMSLSLPELQPENGGVNVPMNVQLVAGMFLAMQRQNEEIVRNFLQYCVDAFGEYGGRDDVENDPAIGPAESPPAAASAGDS